MAVLSKGTRTASTARAAPHSAKPNKPKASKRMKRCTIGEFDGSAIRAGSLARPGDRPAVTFDSRFAAQVVERERGERKTRPERANEPVAATMRHRPRRSC